MKTLPTTKTGRFAKVVYTYYKISIDNSKANQVFIILGSPDVALLGYKDHEGLFLAGALGGLLTEKTDVDYINEDFKRLPRNQLTLNLYFGIYEEGLALNLGECQQICSHFQSL